MLREGRIEYPVTVEDRQERAKYLLDQVREGLVSAAVAAKEFHDGDYWRDLGYPSWRACIKVELGRSTTQAYALLSEATAQSEDANFSVSRKTGETDFTYRAKQKARRTRQTSARLALPSTAPVSPAQSPTDTPIAIQPSDSAPVSLLSVPFPGLQRFLVERDGRGWRLIVAYRDADGVSQLANTTYTDYSAALATLASHWAA